MGDGEGQTETRVLIDRAAAVLTAHPTDWSKAWNQNNKWMDEWTMRSSVPLQVMTSVPLQLIMK